MHPNRQGLSSSELVPYLRLIRKIGYFVQDHSKHRLIKNVLMQKVAGGRLIVSQDTARKQFAH